MDRQPADAALPDDATSADAEQAERLSRAARGVVHEPADPRLEKAFGHLGLFPDGDPDGTPPGPGTPVPTPAPGAAPGASPERPARPAAVTGTATPAPQPAAVDIEPLRAELVQLRAAVDRLDRRLATVTGLLMILAVVVGVVAVLVVVTGA